ncbi:unnamed protein product [Adineta ricciae]|uniref:Uncharacterized protein n=1 Tax=Adineta ricciae TaxID=249248 RepID=A0A815PEZ3_ADIRI|nr:unnamed protein product [Adineta ricciae]CAF1510146.1 unnamed protein product [Adineta ricciae]
MFSQQLHYYFIFLIGFTCAETLLNLYYTNEIESLKNDDYTMDHSCLRFIRINSTLQVWEYQQFYLCLNELLPNISIDEVNFFSQFTFANLSKNNITAEQLLLWSTPIDLIEDYQYYLNGLSTSSNSALGETIYYNCSFPKFGQMCQYELEFSMSINSSFSDLIWNVYSETRSNKIAFTCYIDLNCEYRLNFSCLDWTEICDEKIDCLNNGIDEEHCWQLEVNQCKDNEIQCYSGQCIPLEFFRDSPFIRDCLDQFDEADYLGILGFAEDDTVCRRSFFSRSCLYGRIQTLIERSYSTNNDSVSMDCWSALKCMIQVPDDALKFCTDMCKDDHCRILIENQCPDLLYMPNLPILSDDVYLLYSKGDVIQNNLYPYVCFNPPQHQNFSSDIKVIVFNNRTCFRSEKFFENKNVVPPHLSSNFLRILHRVYEFYNSYHYIINSSSVFCHEPAMYQCIGSNKCIPAYRFRDKHVDCPYFDDEDLFTSNDDFIKKRPQHEQFVCPMHNKHLMIREYTDGFPHCGIARFVHVEDEPDVMGHDKHLLSFQTLCDGYTEIYRSLDTGRNITDETGCEYWECNNYYTACDEVWNCPDGADETNCPSKLKFKCPLNFHACISAATKQMICLPVQKINDGRIDCNNAFDEPNLCLYDSEFHCPTHGPTVEDCTGVVCKCSPYTNILYESDTQNWLPEFSYRPKQNCTVKRDNISLGFISEFCENTMWECPKKKRKYFSMNERHDRTIVSSQMNEPSKMSTLPAISMNNKSEYNCHRGIVVHISANNSKRYTCLCLPSYYGSQCQYQKQRISLGIYYRAFSDSWQTVFVISILLIDNTTEKHIHSTEQYSYLSNDDCKSKFNTYLFYSNRSKDPTKEYFIHIDIYEKYSLEHRASFLYPILFTFLPVYRLSMIIEIPRKAENDLKCSLKSCQNGKCMKYANTNEYFCQCDPGWSGKDCQVEHKCSCSSDSLCLGKALTNRSICICPMNKFGPRCLLTHFICENDNSTCQHGGQCIVYNEHPVLKESFVCICPKGYSGNRCQLKHTYHLTISFHDDIVLFQSIFIHFIEIVNQADPKRTTIIQSIHHFRQKTIELFWFDTFHLIFLEDLNKNYYLYSTINKNHSSKDELVTINPSDRCLPINEIFNETFLQLHPLHRMKYYHLPCLNQSLNLACFHDDTHLCLCYQHKTNKSLANCFEFQHNQTFDCSGQSACENHGQCFQDSFRCPTRSICACRSCYYGKQCQFTTSGFGLSLDAILGYHIIPNLTFVRQSSIVKFSLILTILFFSIGLLNSIIALITFQRATIREVGCGLYLLGTSITSLFTTVLLGLKYSILISAQMNVLTNRSFLRIQCYSIDFLLQTSLYLDLWLDAFIAIERAMTVAQGVRFQKDKSKKLAKLVVLILILMIVATNIHDPINRQLIKEENEELNDMKRLWCIVRYSSTLQVYNTILNSFHFFLPFLLNIVSTIILITKVVKQQFKMKNNRKTIREIAREQFQQHQHLVIAPIVLIILSMPRLVISFISKCLKSNNDSWLYLCGYFISFIPSIITCFIFILPSSLYKTELRKAIAQYRTRIRQCFQKN